ncbi:hypothetical protein H6G89_04145 [Oscillatoria sp. FACHB-1407]|nr:hypothetical protein [Oscillatoria sp. FACHB-1407]
MPTAQAIAQPIPWQFDEQTLQPTFPVNREQRSLYLGCFIQQAQLDADGRLPAYRRSEVVFELLYLAVGFQQQGQPTQAKQALDQAASLLLTEDLYWSEILILEKIAGEYIQQGFLEEGRSRLEQTLIAARQPNVVESTVTEGLFARIAGHYRLSDRLEQSRAVLAEARQIAQREGYRFSSEGLGLMAVEYIKLGDYDSADAMVADARQTLPDTLTGFHRWLTVQPMIRQYINVGADDRAQRLIAQEPRAEQLQLLQVMAEQYASIGQAEPGLAALDQAVAIAKTTSYEDMQYAMLDPHRLWLELVEQYIQLGQPERALHAIAGVEQWSDPRTPEYLKLYITAAMGRTDATFETLESSINEYGNWRDIEVVWDMTLSRIIKLYTERNQLDHLERLYALAPFQKGATDIFPWQHPTRFELALTLGHSYLTTGQTAAAQSIFASVLEDLSNPEVRSTLNYELMIRDLLAWQIKYGQYEAAVQLVEQFPSELNGDYWRPRLACAMQ